MLGFFKRFFNTAPGALALGPLAVRKRTSGPTVAIVNKSTVLSDQEVYHACVAMQKQIDRDFAPVWQISANLRFIGANATIPANSWIIYMMDTSDVSGALGYHDITDEGNPIGKIFAKDDFKYGLSWTVTLSHELMETLVDPYVTSCAFVQDTATTGTLYALETADPVEADELGYMINDVRVSNFIYPTWFEGFRKPGSVKFDHMNVLSEPLSLASGGYASVFEVPNSGGGWTQRVASSGPGKRLMAKTRTSRTHRRGHPLS